MARYTGPKNKLARRAGQDLGLKTNPQKTARRLNIPPGQHGRKGTRKLSEYGIQLKEKQKVKWMYGVLEKQLRNYMQLATRDEAATGTELLRLLERRLDNVIYRLNLAPTRNAARQLVVHGHVRVNGNKLDIPSYQVNINDTITLTTKALKIPAVVETNEQAKSAVPKWLQKKAVVGKVVDYPQRDDIDAEINENLIIEYYSR